MSAVTSHDHSETLDQCCTRPLLHVVGLLTVMSQLRCTLLQAGVKFVDKFERDSLD